MPARTPRLLPFISASLIGITGGCATAPPLPPESVARALLTPTYSATLRFSISGKDVHGRGRAVAAFARPDRLRLEVPGPAGLRLVAVTRGGTLVVVYPGERAVFRGEADRATFQELFGLALTPEEVMDVLVGTPPPSLRTYRAEWGSSLPRGIGATLSDGTNVKLQVEGAQGSAELPEEAFLEPPHDSYRSIDAQEARSLWSPK